MGEINSRFLFFVKRFFLREGLERNERVETAGEIDFSARGDFAGFAGRCARREDENRAPSGKSVCLYRSFRHGRA